MQLHLFALLTSQTAMEFLSVGFFSVGHIELQGQTLYAVLSRIASMYADLSYDISTGEEFSEELIKLFKNVSQTLKIQNQVEDRLAVAQRVKEVYGFRRAARGDVASPAAAAAAAAAAGAAAGTAAAAAADGWERVWGVDTDADLALKWLQHQTKPSAQNPAVLRAEFVAIFPDAGPVVQQKFEVEVPPSPREPPGFFRRVWYYIVGEPPPPPPKKIPDPLEVSIHPINAAEYL
ncbi:hypothetical protein, conserved [Eimeria brunetti]|uniref:Uncharacterized protein n=1 Tax=Eimeria brunetti TaxID=51314 RepID=U6LUI9_9EIME|nr:hypothetical protein, conserved [Eimeria brunetti]